MFNTDNIVESIQKLHPGVLTKIKMRILYKNCQMSSAFSLVYPELIYLKWMKQEEFDKAIENLKE